MLSTPMELSREMVHEGNWLFRYRSYLPLLVLAMSAPYMLGFWDADHGPRVNHRWELFALAVSLSGLLLRVVTIGSVPFGTSGRNTRKQVATGLNTSGMYSVMRHPLYVGNAIIWIGISLFFQALSLSLVVLLVCWLYHERIAMAEEAFLKRQFGQAFAEWAERTPAFIPKLSQWRPAELSFSMRTAFKREYHGLFSIISTFVLLDFLANCLANKRVVFDRAWLSVWVASLVLFIAARMLKKSSNLLNVQGR